MRQRRTREWELPDGSMSMEYAARLVPVGRPTRPTQLPQRVKRHRPDAKDEIFDPADPALPFREEIDRRRRLFARARTGDQRAIDALWTLYRCRFTLGP